MNSMNATEISVMDAWTLVNYKKSASALFSPDKRWRADQ